MAIIAVISILAVTNIALAVLYMTKTVSISGGVSVVGLIEVYDADGTTPLTNINFANFTGSTIESRDNFFFINNTGTVDVFVYWNMSASSISWVQANGNYYSHLENDVEVFQFSVLDRGGMYWRPDTQHLMIPAKSSLQHFDFHLGYNGNAETSEKFTLSVTFYATDA